MNFDVFISYPHEDKATADAACAKLEAESVRCWIAPRDVRPSADWAASIVDAIDNCRVMVLIFSSRANQSKQVHREVQRAFDQEKPVVPFRIENTVPEKTLAYYMGPVHWLDALTPPFERHLDTLAQSIKGLLQIAPVADVDQRWGITESPPAEEERRAAEEAERQRKAAQAQAARRAEAERQAQEADAARRAAEEAQRKKIETEAITRAVEEGRRQKAATAKRIEQEGAFAATKRADTVSAVDEFLAAYPESHLTGEAKALRLKLTERDDAYKATLGRTEPRFSLRPSRRTLVIGGGAAGVGAVATVTAMVLQPYRWEIGVPSNYIGPLRFDGTYQTSISSNPTVLDHFRFYPDGSVVEMWQHHNEPKPTPTTFVKGQGQGSTTASYTISGTHIKFSMPYQETSVDYEGTIGDSTINLNIFSHIGERPGARAPFTGSHHDDVYQFVPWSS